MNKRRIYLSYLLTLIVVVLLSFSFSESGKVSRYWIVFKDKGVYKPTEIIKPGTEAYEKGKSLLTERAIQRRLKVLPEEKLIDFWDLPIEESYVSQIKGMGIDILAKSRWFNGVSANMTKEQLDKVIKSDIVAQVRILDKVIKNNVVSYAPIEYTSYDNQIFLDNKSEPGDKLNYGKSKKQIYQLNVQKLHNMGISGKGVLIGMFDSGFEWKDHEATLDLNIIDEIDFINKDKNTANEKSQKYTDKDDQSMHGTATLSTMAGFKDGKLIGPAYASNILLAKTEYGATETPMEEDYYLEAAEWVESLGADIITSSLGYRTFDEGFEENNYTWNLFNGHYAITSLAGERAAYLGIVVLSSVGNNRQTDPPSLGSPAEGDSILAVGAVDSYGEIAGFSSNGPTSDGRIKPDIVALGVGDYCATSKVLSGVDSNYARLNGTSFSCPLSAGVAALILSAHPELTPMQVRDAMRNTADKADKPNNIFGWGLIDAFKAALYYGMIWSNEASVEKDGKDLIIKISVASNDKLDLSKMEINYVLNGSAGVYVAPLTVVENPDNLISTDFMVRIKGAANSKIEFFFRGKDSKGKDSTYPPTPFKY